VVAVAAWYHPLPGPELQLPGYASRRFGAARHVIRPPECERGHCGVDIGSTIGAPVLAIHDGVVDRVQRNPAADPISGIFVILSHKQGAVRSRYIHLDSIRADLVVGSVVHGGEMIGRLGRTGIQRSAAHLHFGLSLREGGRERYVDPEPYLREWRLVEPEARYSAAAPPKIALTSPAAMVNTVPPYTDPTTSASARNSSGFTSLP
jgi:murein DD-endopeptidase MepM/ murein hydrolase activator NlpD